nr:MAG TPA: Dynein light chain type 1 [Caudoviricetes sp.]
MTNGEMIREAKTDEQLASVLNRLFPNECPPGWECMVFADNVCSICWCAWLAQEEEK